MKSISCVWCFRSLESSRRRIDAIDTNSAPKRKYGWPKHTVTLFRRLRSHANASQGMSDAGTERRRREERNRPNFCALNGRQKWMREIAEREIRMRSNEIFIEEEIKFTKHWHPTILVLSDSPSLSASPDRVDWNNGNVSTNSRAKYSELRE